MQLNIPVVLDDSHGSGVAGPDGCAFQKEPRPLDFDNSLFSGVCGNAGRPRETDCKITQNSREKGCDDSRERNYPIRVSEFFEYAGGNFKKEYVERGAFIIFGIIGAICGGIYYARRAVRQE